MYTITISLMTMAKGSPWMQMAISILATGTEIEQYVKMNDIGSANGKLKVWVDGNVALDMSDLEFIEDDDTKISRVWLNYYYGGSGTSSQSNVVFIDNVKAAGAQIGAKFAAPLAGSETPSSFDLHPNYPNPFNTGTTIRYALPESVPTILAVYNSLGQEIRTLVDQVGVPGVYEVTWDGVDNNGAVVSSGVYLYRLQAGPFSRTGKMSLEK